MALMRRITVTCRIVCKNRAEFPSATSEAQVPAASHAPQRRGPSLG